VFADLAERLRGVSVMCGDWSRVVTDAVLFGGRKGATGVFLDPPYDVSAGREDGLYAHDANVSGAVREWAIAHGDDPRLRIALCGYAGEHDMPDSWSELAWKAHGGMGSQANERARENSKRERVWFSPHCRRVGLWEAAS
jgi:hypothetical protein